MEIRRLLSNLRDIYKITRGVNIANSSLKSGKVSRMATFPQMLVCTWNELPKVVEVGKITKI